MFAPSFFMSELPIERFRVLIFPIEVCRNFFFKFLGRSDSAVQAGPGEEIVSSIK
jgi:hypothetical protein